VSSLQQSLDEALVAKDWPRIEKIDLSIRELLEHLRANALLTLFKPEIEALMLSHRQAEQRCAEECKRLRDILDQHTTHGDGRNAYMQLDSLLPER
jgi:hypothetical protein